MLKGAFFAGVLLSGFYIFSLHVVMTQIKAMENFYSNIDQYAAAAVNNKSDSPITPQPLQTAIHPFSNTSQTLPN